MQEKIKPGDIPFFTSPAQPNAFGRYNERYQWNLSWLLCNCRKDDYKKTHVAICVQTDPDIRIAHVGFGTPSAFRISEITNPYLKVSERHCDILRPKDEKFAQQLVANISSLRDADLLWTRESWNKVTQRCPTFSCDPALPEVKKAGFNVSSHCSRFIVEALNMTAKDTSLPYSVDNENLSVMRLWQKLEPSRQYVHISDVEFVQEAKSFAAAKVEEPAEEREEEQLSAPLLVRGGSES